MISCELKIKGIEPVKVDIHPETSIHDMLKSLKLPLELENIEYCRALYDQQTAIDLTVFNIDMLRFAPQIAIGVHLRKYYGVAAMPADLFCDKCTINHDNDMFFMKE